MRILIITATYTPSINGVAISLAQQKEELKKRGHEITLLAPKHDKQVEEKGVIRLPSLPNPAYPDYPILLPIPTIHNLRILANKYDLVYFHHPFYIGDLAINLAKYFACSSIFFYHSQYEKQAMVFKPKLIPAKSVSGLIKKNILHISSKADHIIIETNSRKDYLIDQGITTPITVIPSARKIIKIKKTRKQLRKKYGFKPEECIILCVSRLSKEKNIASLIRMFGKIKLDKLTKLCVVGDGPYKDELEKFVKSLKLSSNCIFLGNITHDKIAEIYTLADIFAYPSKSDVQPGVITEALTYGLPVIAFNVTGPEDMILNGENGFLVNSKNEFILKLELLINDKNKRLLMQKKATRISHSYTFTDSIDRLENLFESVTTF